MYVITIPVNLSNDNDDMAHDARRWCRYKLGTEYAKKFQESGKWWFPIGVDFRDLDLGIDPKRYRIFLFSDRTDAEWFSFVWS